MKSNRSFVVSRSTGRAGAAMLLATLVYAASELLFPRTALGWGSEMHRLVARAAVDDLPPAMIDDGSGNAFDDWRDFLAEHSIDPDLNKSDDPDESERHWLDIDAHSETFPYPFTNIPRRKDQYLLVFVRADGVLPWEGWEDTYQRLAAAFRERRWAEAYLEAAWLAHYAGDAHSPMHGTENYNGQLSIDRRNRGIHSRHESNMSNLYITDATTTLGSAVRIDDRVEQAFATITNSWTVSRQVLEADLAAQTLAGDGNFNSIYYAEMWRLVGAETQSQIDEAARMTASLWYSAWVDAGRPRFGGSAMLSIWMLY